MHHKNGEDPQQGAQPRARDRITAVANKKPYRTNYYTMQ